jgi:hypothetical protein
MSRLTVGAIPGEQKGDGGGMKGKSALQGRRKLGS